MQHETDKYRHLVLPFIKGNVIDLGSGGCPVVPHAVQIELPKDEFAKYNNHAVPAVEPQWRGDAFDLPFRDETVDTVYSSHLLEDVFRWEPVLAEWVRVLKPRGHLVIMVPDRERFAAAVRNGQPPNDAHRHESYPGEISHLLKFHGFPIDTIVDGFTNIHPGDYNILFAGRKK